MGLFGKKTKKKEEETDKELEDSKETPNKKVFKKKDFKDLNAENKKQRREPKKPWGRGERILVAVVLVLTTGISLFLWLRSEGFVFKPKLPNFFREQTIIIENDN